MNIFDVFKGECGFSVGVDGETERMCRHFKARWGKQMNNALAQTKACKKNFSVLTFVFL